MTNVIQNATPVSSPPERPAPLDQLVPPPRPTWQRVLTGFAVIGGVGVIAWYVGSGGVYPRPDCCGSGGGGVTMALTPDFEAVATTVTFYNSSARSIEIAGVEAAIGGATVRGIGLISDDFVREFPTADFEQPPLVVAPRSFARVLVEFTPDRCDDRTDDEWDVRLRLDTTGRLPGFDRTVRLDERPAGERISYFGPAGFDQSNPDVSVRPLAGACALLAAAP
jgi:hypothetical protein